MKSVLLRSKAFGVMFLAVLLLIPSVFSYTFTLTDNGTFSQWKTVNAVKVVGSVII
ncbi:hypothetical protein HZB01_00655 [Candidatus Woesearchaeota archaeon]|nr:hypothetical protein [Candidatus Woesearchaeota archaeon]